MNFYRWKEELKNKKIYIWGASIGGNQAFICLQKNGIQVEAFCDNDKQKQEMLCNGKSVIPPELLKKEWGDDAVIIIASYAYEDIYRQIQKIGIECKVYIYLLYDPCHLKAGKQFSEEEKEAIRALYSREPYTDRLIELILEGGLLNTDGFGDIMQYLGYGGLDRYYYDDVAKTIINTKVSLTLLDVGSYVGDSILQIKSVFHDQICKIYGFEPSHENCIEIKKKNIENLVLYEFGLGNVNSCLNFTEKGPFFRASGKENGIPTQVYKLDDFDLYVEGKCILKIDIEGMEMACLEGAKEFICKHKPYIAVCVYHKENDIFDIPRYIKSLMPRYHFLLRGGMHTVCYAFPEEGN